MVVSSYVLPVRPMFPLHCSLLGTGQSPICSHWPPNGVFLLVGWAAPVFLSLLTAGHRTAQSSVLCVDTVQWTAQLWIVLSSTFGLGSGAPIIHLGQTIHMHTITLKYTNIFTVALFTALAFHTYILYLTKSEFHKVHLICSETSSDLYRALFVLQKNQCFAKLLLSVSF